MEIRHHLPYNYSRLTQYCNVLLCGRGMPQGITETNCTGFWYSSSKKGLKASNKQNIWVFFQWEVKIYFIGWIPSVIFSLVAAPLVKILLMVSTWWNKFRSFTVTKKQISSISKHSCPYNLQSVVKEWVTIIFSWQKLCKKGSVERLWRPYLSELTFIMNIS